MAKNGQPKSRKPSPSVDGITRVIVGGFKSLAHEQSIEIRPLTILAGANSSGKSSIMQPLLLLKQTLESSYDAGALRLNGANLQFTAADQMFSRPRASRVRDVLSVGVEIEGEVEITTFFERGQKGAIDVERMLFKNDKNSIDININMTSSQVDEMLGGLYKDAHFRSAYLKNMKQRIVRDRCFLNVSYGEDGIPSEVNIYMPLISLGNFKNLRILSQGVSGFKSLFTSVIHLPGLRGTPCRDYPVAAAGPNYPGTFEEYTAGVIHRWQEENSSEQLTRLSGDLSMLGLTWKVVARRINDAQIELQVGRLPQSGRGSSRDLVSIADVGLGVSQALPVLVALNAAAPGQLVYLEQPEIHLHPRAQAAMAKVLADAAKRGVRVVVETHSDLLILGVQTEVAKGNLPPDLVKLHWFQRLKDGSTQITSGDVDEAGRSGNWPEDFDDVRLDAQSEFLDASLDFKESR